MTQYRKKPIVIEAYQFHNRVCTPEDRPDWILEAVADKRIQFQPANDRAGVPFDRLMIPTLEGIMEAHPGDWIIKGIKGELYPCKPDIFSATYEAVS